MPCRLVLHKYYIISFVWTNSFQFHQKALEQNGINQLAQFLHIVTITQACKIGCNKIFQILTILALVKGRYQTNSFAASKFGGSML